MQSSRFVPGKHAAFGLVVCLGLLCPALTRAEDSVNLHLEAGSVQHTATKISTHKHRPVKIKLERPDGPDAAELAEISDYLLSGLAPVVQGVVLTMAASPWSWKPTDNGPGDPVPESLVPIIVQPPPAPSDNPGGDNGNPTPSGEAPEPSTLLTALAGAGALVYRLYRRRRGKGTPEQECSDDASSAVEIAPV